MKIKFTKLVTPSETIQISFDGGETYKTYDVEGCKTNGVSFTEEDCPDLTKIVIKGKFKSFSDTVDVVKNLSSSDDAYPTIEILPVLGYSGGLQFEIVNKDDESVSDIVKMVDQESYQLHIAHDANSGVLPYLDFNDFGTEGNIYYVGASSSIPVQIAKYSYDNTAKIPVSYYTIYARGCGAYCLYNSGEGESHGIYNALMGSTDANAAKKVYIPLGKVSDITYSDSSENYTKTINGILYMMLYILDDRYNSNGTSFIGITGTDSLNVLKSLDGNSFYVYDSDTGTMTESKYYLDLGLATDTSIDGLYVRAYSSGGYELCYDETTTLFGKGFSSWYVTTNPGTKTTGTDVSSSNGYYRLEDCIYIASAQDLLNLSGSEIYTYNDGTYVDTGYTIGNINDLTTDEE